MNKRKVIRRAFVDLLKGRTRALFSVHSSRVRPFLNQEMPAINITAGGEEAEVTGEAPFRYTRTLTITIELYLRGKFGQFDDEFDDFVNEVEDLVDGQDLFTLASEVDRVYLLNSRVEYSPDDSAESGIAVLEYAVQYYTYAGVDPEKLDPFEGIDASWDQNDFTTDTIDFPQT